MSDNVAKYCTQQVYDDDDQNYMENSCETPCGSSRMAKKMHNLFMDRVRHN